MFCNIPIILVLFVACLTISFSFAFYCQPQETCWPSQQDITNFKKRLHGILVQPSDIDYNITKPKYLNWIPPAFAVVVNKISDVTEAINFAKEHNLKISIFSSGHDLNGRSSGKDSLQINFAFYNKITVNLQDGRHPAGVVHVDSGAKWIDVYKETDIYKKHVVGGACPDVSVSGLMMAGGYSVLTRSHGLVVDNVVEIKGVLANGTAVTCSQKGTTLHLADNQDVTLKSNDLFWAVRGGGGGTFIVITSITFKLHDAPPQMVLFHAIYPMDINKNYEVGKQTLQFIIPKLAQLSKEWGCLMLTMPNFDPNSETNTILLLFLIQNAQWDSPSTIAIQDFIDYKPDLRINSIHTNTTLLNFMQMIRPITDVRAHFSHAFFSFKHWTPKHIDLLAETIPQGIPNTNFEIVCSLISGHTNTVSDTRDSSVSTFYRQADLNCVTGTMYTDLSLDSKVLAHVSKLNDRMAELGSGSQFNEGAYHAKDHTAKFWGENYNRLLQVKRMYDPENLFTCHHCVGEVATKEDTTYNKNLVFIITVLIILSSVYLCFFKR